MNSELTYNTFVVLCSDNRWSLLPVPAGGERKSQELFPLSGRSVVQSQLGQRPKWPLANSSQPDGISHSPGRGCSEGVTHHVGLSSIHASFSGKGGTNPESAGKSRIFSFPITVSPLVLSSVIFHVFPPQPPGLPSAQSIGPIHLPALAPVGPVLIPGHSGICRRPLPALLAAQCWFCASAAVEMSASCCWAPAPPSRSSTQGGTTQSRLFHIKSQIHGGIIHLFRSKWS